MEQIFFNDKHDIHFTWMGIFLLAVCLLSACREQQLSVLAPRCEYEENPLGVETARPALSWEIRSPQRNIVQKEYRVLVSDNLLLLQKDKGNIWDSGVVASDASIQVPYGGIPLEAAKKYFWKVKVWDNLGNESDWSDAATWQTGLLSEEDWKGAQWIGYEALPDTEKIIPAWHGNGPVELGPRHNILPLFRKQFTVEKELKRAIVLISGLGHFDLHLDGKKVGDHFLDPGWTLYQKDAQYVVFDITGQLRPGDHVVGVMLGNGFFYIPGEGYRKITGAYGYPKMICRLILEYEDGAFHSIVSDDSWKSAPGPVTFSSIYSGEDYDATLEQAGWDTPAFDDRAWRPAVVTDGPPNLKSQMAPPLKIFDNFSPRKIFKSGTGRWVYDLGQNASGIPQISVRGNKGSKLSLITSELYEDTGLTGQNARFSYILKGEGTETWQPRFMYHGFRYVQVEGGVPEGEANPDNLPVISSVKGLHTRSAAKSVGEFYCSNDLFNRINKLIDWAVRSNMASVITDCPHREKLGWLEEVHLVGNSIQYNYDIAGLCRKIIDDMKASQTPEGLIPDIAPEYVVFDGGFRDSPEWGSSGVILPWYLYQWYGDKATLENSYSMMQRYVDYLDKKSVHHILSHGLGDWVDIGPNPPGESQNTPFGITATAIFYYDICILNKVATLLNKPEDALKYRELALKVKEAFNERFFNRSINGYGANSQAANAIPVYMDLVEPENKEAVIANIVRDVRDRGNSLTVGDIGFRYLLQVLSDAGRSDVIFDMNSRTDVPGYGYQLEQGATALTESWQAFRNLSHNHLMLGHLMEWFYNGLGGIRQAENSVAFKTIVLKPEPVGDLNHVRVQFRSPYGLIKSEWRKQAGRFTYTIEVPANTRATVFLPVIGKNNITEGGKPIEEAYEIVFMKTDENHSVYQVGSGIYSFEIE